VPLPENWNGRFWSKRSNGDMLFDLEPDAFVSKLREFGENAPFLVAASYVDLTLNGYPDRARLFLEKGREVWPEKKWSDLESLTAEWQAGHEDAHYMSNAVAKLFDDIQVFV
jgi:hypothetical protein